MRQLILTMNVNGEEINVMQEQVAYFDAQHKWAKGFKTLGLLVYHPTMH